MLLRLDSCVRRNDEGLSAAMEPKFWDFAENNVVFCIMRHPPCVGTQTGLDAKSITDKIEAIDNTQ